MPATYTSYSHSVGEVTHNLGGGGEGEDGEQGEGQLHGHDSVQEVVHAGQVVDILHGGGIGVMLEGRGGGRGKCVCNLPNSRDLLLKQGT